MMCWETLFPQGQHLMPVKDTNLWGKKQPPESLYSSPRWEELLLQEPHNWRNSPGMTKVGMKKQQGLEETSVWARNPIQWSEKERGMAWICFFKHQAKRIISVRIGTNIASMVFQIPEKAMEKSQSQGYSWALTYRFLDKRQLAVPDFSICHSLLCNPYPAARTPVVSQFAPLLSFSWLSSDYNATLQLQQHLFWAWLLSNL